MISHMDDSQFVIEEKRNNNNPSNESDELLEQVTQRKPILPGNIQQVLSNAKSASSVISSNQTSNTASHLKQTIKLSQMSA